MVTLILTQFLVYFLMSMHLVSSKTACSDINYETFDDPRWQIDPLNCNMFYGCDRTDRADFITIYHHYHYSCGLKYWSQEQLKCVKDIRQSSCLSHDTKNFAITDVTTDKDDNSDCEYETVPGHPNKYIHRDLKGGEKECDKNYIFDTSRCKCKAAYRKFSSDENGAIVPEWLANLHKKDATEAATAEKSSVLNGDSRGPLSHNGDVQNKMEGVVKDNGDLGGPLHLNDEVQEKEKVAGKDGDSSTNDGSKGPLHRKGDMLNEIKDSGLKESKEGDTSSDGFSNDGNSEGVAKNKDRPTNDVNLHSGKDKANADLKAKKKKGCKDIGILLCYPFDKDLDSHSINWVKTAVVHVENGQLVETDQSMHIVEDENRGKVVEMAGSKALMIPFLKNWLRGWDLKQWSVFTWFKMYESMPGVYSLVNNAGLMKSIDEDEAILSPSFFIDIEVEDGSAYVYGGLQTSISMKTTGRQPIETSGAWHQVAIVYNGKQLKFYCDKQLVSATHLRGGVSNKDNPAYVGVTRWGENHRFFNGLIDELRIYAMELTPADIAALP